MLRGINVGKAKRVAMADLRSVFEALGHEDVKTLLNSGNVVYSSGSGSGAEDAIGIEEAVAAKLGVRSRVTTIDGRDLVKAVEENPFDAAAGNPSRLLLLVLQDGKVGARLKPLLKERWVPEALALERRIAYLWCPDGILAGKLWNAADRLVGNEGTARNLATMTKIVAAVNEA